MGIFNLPALVLLVLVMIYLRKRFGLPGKVVKKVMICVGVLFAIYFISVLTGSPFVYVYHEMPIYDNWCWGPKNEKGEYTLLHTKLRWRKKWLKGLIYSREVEKKSFPEVLQINQINIDGSNNRKLFTSEKMKFSLEDYCHKTNEIVGRKKGNMRVAKFDGSDKRCILSETPEERIRNVRFSPDGKLIAYIRCTRKEESHLWVVDVEGEWRKRLCRTQVLAWHPSGKYLATEREIVDLEGNSVCQFPVGISTNSFSPDGGYLVGYHRMLRIKREIKDGKEVWQAEKVPAAPGAGRCSKWSPCGRYITQECGEGIRLVDLLIGTTEVLLSTVRQRHHPGYNEWVRKELADFRTYIKRKDPQWWNNMVNKFPELNLGYVKER